MLEKVGRDSQGRRQKGRVKETGAFCPEPHLFRAPSYIITLIEQSQLQQ